MSVSSRVGSGADFEAGLSRHFLRGLVKDKDEPVDARWASLGEVTGQKWRFGSEPGMMFLGYRDGLMIGRKDDRHQITIGGSRGGKGVSLIIPTLATYEGNVIAIDPKGELARVTSRCRLRRLGQKVIVLDPFGQSGLPANSYNPLAEILEYAPDDVEKKRRWPTAIDDALAIAEALVVQSSSETYWSDAAKALIQALILFTLVGCEPKDRNLLAVRDFIALRDRVVVEEAASHDGNKAIALFKLMELEKEPFNGVIAGVAAQFLSMGERERGGVMSNAKTQTDFLDSDGLASCLRSSDFSLDDVKKKPTTLYLCLPASNMGTHAKWLRMIITMALRMCERVKIEPPPPHPVLFVLDEFSVLGHMRVIESAAGQMAGYGVKLWTILQDLGQLQNAYKGTWETFFGNAAIATFHAVADVTTLEYLSKRLGTRTFKVQVSTDANFNAVTHAGAVSSSNLQNQPLAPPHELEFALARERKRMVVLFPGSRPLILERAISHDEHETWLELLA